MGVYEDKRNGSWYYQFEYEKNPFKECGFKSYLEAFRAERSQLRRIEDGEKPLPVDYQDITFPEAAKIFYDEYACNIRSEGNYRTRIPVIVLCPEMQKKLASLTKSDIVAMRNFVAKTVKVKKRNELGVVVEEPISTHSVNHYHAHVKCIIQWWIKFKEFKMDNPAMRVTMPRVPKARIRFLYPAEETVLTPAVMSHSWLYPYYVVGIETGLREANICSIKVKDIDLTLGQIFIPDSKNGRSGYVPISDRLEPYIKAWIAGKQPDDYLLKGYLPTSISNSFTKLCRKAGIKDFSFHCLRHTFAYYHLSRGESLYMVSHLLLHESESVTQKHYGHLAMKDLKDVVNGGKGIITHSTHMTFVLESTQKSTQMAKNEIVTVEND